NRAKVQRPRKEKINSKRTSRRLRQEREKKTRASSPRRVRPLADKIDNLPENRSNRKNRRLLVAAKINYRRHHRAKVKVKTKTERRPRRRAERRRKKWPARPKTRTTNSIPIRNSKPRKSRRPSPRKKDR